MRHTEVDTSELDKLREEMSKGIDDVIKEPAKGEVSSILSHDESATDNGKPTIAIDDKSEPELPDYDSYYDCTNKGFLVKNNRGEWIPATEAHVKRELRKIGYRNRVQDGENISQVDEKLSEIHLERDVKFAGAVAGHKVGLIEDKSGRILVTNGPEIIEPVKGSWPTIKEYMTSLFGAQIDYVFGWLQVRYNAVASGDFVPSWALAIAGQKGNGKSFFQHHIATPILGGREALPYRYMTGGTAFNADLIGAEHLVIEDETSSTDIRSRRNFGEKIKSIVANQTQSLHGKNKNALTVRPLWSLTVTLNEEPENIAILPPLIDGLADKITMLKSDKATNLPAQEDREEFLAKVNAEMPAFVYYLANEYVIPEDIKDARFGVRAYHHPDVLEALGELSAEVKFDSIVRAVLFKKLDQPYLSEWTGSATELEHKLRESAFASEIRILMGNHAAACGTLLGRLDKNYATRNRYYKLKLLDGIQQWRIYEKPVEREDHIPV
ncbi:MAG: primase-helicase family protein [Alphaproteobacteria bacterium]